MQIVPNRRRFLTGLSALAAAGLTTGRNAEAAEAPPETTVARFAAAPGICIAPGIARRLQESPAITGWMSAQAMNADRPEID